MHLLWLRKELCLFFVSHFREFDSNAEKIYIDNMINEYNLRHVCRMSTDTFSLKGIPGCLFARTSLSKSSNSLEPICNFVNVKFS